jgi:hypothetical protein
MDKARIAERILALVLSPDRAASAVGDWMEDADVRGPVWFWSCVFRTAISQVWSDLAGSPRLMVRVGLTGLCRLLLPLYGFGCLLDVLMTNLPALRHWMWSGDGWRVTVLWNVVLLPVWLFQTGRWIAQRAPGPVAAGCIAIAFAVSIFTLVVDVSMWSAGVHLPPYTLAKGLATQIPCNMVLFAGAVWTRRSSVGSTA